MCGITGAFNNKDAKKIVEKSLEIMKDRGIDGKGIYGQDSCFIGHRLHSVVSFVKQPLFGSGSVFVSNNEIYNWKELSSKHKINAENDSELMLKMLDKNGLKALDEFNGVYTFAYWKDDKIMIARDIIGEKPVWYSHADGFSFASEKKALEGNGIIDCHELNPRQILVYDIKKDEIEFLGRDFFKATPEHKESKEEMIAKVKELLLKAVIKRIPEKKFGILFSGGIDSTVIAKICKDHGSDFICYTTVLTDGDKDAEDLVYAEKVAEKMGFTLKIIKIRKGDIEKYLKTLIPLIEDNNVVKVEVGLTFFAACEQAKKDGCKVIFSGLGSEEIFAGYQRHKESDNINKECISGLIKLYERDLYRDDVITMNNNLELRLPFLDSDLINYCLKIPEKYKIADGKEKLMLRYVAAELGVMKEVCERKKKAAQYGSNIDKAMKKIADSKGLKRSEYFRQFYPGHNVILGALVSSGKDSIYALHVMHRQNYKIKCLITIASKNKDSFMFHTPNIDMAKLQAEALGIPIVVKETLGEKEEELKDLEEALKRAKRDFGIQGVITGALFSNYQRERIEKVADRLGLKIFSPLWHKKQEILMKEIIDEGFEVILSSVAAEGLDKTWLGRRLVEKDIEKLVKMNAKTGINIAFEGGEAESLVLDAPLFKKKIVIEDSETIMENERTGRFVVKKARLEEK